MFLCVGGKREEVGKMEIRNNIFLFSILQYYTLYFVFFFSFQFDSIVM